MQHPQKGASQRDEAWGALPRCPQGQVCSSPSPGTGTSAWVSPSTLPTPCSECAWAGWSHFSLSWGQDCSRLLGDLTHELSVICTLSQPPAAPQDLHALSRTPGRGGVSSGSQAGCTPGCRAPLHCSPAVCKAGTVPKAKPCSPPHPQDPLTLPEAPGEAEPPPGSPVLGWGVGGGAGGCI